MKALLVLLFIASSALASPLVKPPDGWKGGANDELVHATGITPHFGGVHGIIEAERYDAPKPGVVLYVTRVAVNMSAPDPATRAEIDQLHPTASSSARETEWQERFDPATKQVEVRLAYRDTSVNITGRVHMIVAATKDKIVASKAECLVADDGDPANAKACFAALDTIDPGVEAKDRVAIDLDAKAGAGSGSASGSGSDTSTSTNPTMSATRTPMPPIPVAQEAPPADRRPMIVGAGIVALAIVFWWNRRRRDRIEAEMRGEDHE